MTFALEWVKNLIARDILVVSAGCTCGGLENCGLMSLDAARIGGTGFVTILAAALGFHTSTQFRPLPSRIGCIEAVAGNFVAGALEWICPNSGGSFTPMARRTGHCCGWDVLHWPWLSTCTWGWLPFCDGYLTLDVLCNQMRRVITGGKLIGGEQR